MIESPRDFAHRVVNTHLCAAKCWEKNRDGTPYYKGGHSPLCDVLTAEVERRDGERTNDKGEADVQA